MGAETKITSPKLSRAKPADGHQWRSELLDAFADLEATLVAKCRELGLLVSPKSTLAQKLGAIKNIDATWPDEAKSAIEGCLALVEMRNDLVHAKLHLVMLADEDGGPTFLFRNVALATSDGLSVCRMVNEEGFKSLRKQVRQSRNEIILLKAPTPAASEAPTE